jgi:dTDP-4-dehydrorhamnose 3,5-epimerase
MNITPLDVPGAFVVTPQQFGDDRGVFLEWFRLERFAASVGHSLRLAQANCSVSSRGTLRGIHYADVPPGQAKYVTCTGGSVLDVVVDIRVGSPTFGAWQGVLLDTKDRKAVYIGEGLGHAFLALEDDSTVVYLCSESYNPVGEREINPLDPAIGIDWPLADIDGAPKLSAKDAAAPSLSEAAEAGLLPLHATVEQFVSDLP